MFQGSHVPSAPTPVSEQNQKNTPVPIANRLTWYATAATAAGVSMAALIQPATAEVVVTHKTIPIPPFYATFENTQLDINGDGITDISFAFTTFGPYAHFVGSLAVAGEPGREVITDGEGPDRPLVAALLRGAKVGPSAHFSSAQPLAVIEHSSESSTNQKCFNLQSYGHWNGKNADRFVGVKFQIHGTTHYGWVRLDVARRSEGNGSGCRDMTATITAYAYETVPNKAITIGGTAAALSGKQLVPASLADRPSLGALAQGAEALPLWRRKEE